MSLRRAKLSTIKGSSALRRRRRSIKAFHVKFVILIKTVFMALFFKCQMQSVYCCLSPVFFLHWCPTAEHVNTL